MDDKISFKRESFINTLKITSNFFLETNHIEEDITHFEIYTFLFDSFLIDSCFRAIYCFTHRLYTEPCVVHGDKYNRKK